MKKKSATHTTKHKGTSKHAATAKHKAHEEHLAHEAHEAHLAHEGKVHAVAKPAKPKKPAKARSLTPGDVGCCAAEALAASLRLAGGFVADGDVLDLFWRAGGDPEAGTSILAALRAASGSGLAGYRPVFEEVMPSGSGQLDLYAHDPRLRVTRAGQLPAAGLILGLELPGPHAVLATADGWWSWGELHDPAEWPDAVVEEAWAVRWG